MVEDRPVDVSSLTHKTRQMLRSSGLRCTRGHVAILTVLLATGKPLSQRQIADSPDCHHLDKVTIYRALARFQQVGLVHRAFLRNRAWHFELAHHCGPLQCHPHFNCLACGATHCLIDVSPPLAAGLQAGFIVQRQQIRLEGLCPTCSAGSADLPSVL